MKIAIGIILIIGIGLILLSSKRNKITMNKNQLNKKQEFLILDDGNQNELFLYSTVTQEWIDSTKSKYDWDNYDEYDNRMWEYMYKLFDDVVEKSDAKDNDELWNKLNRPQKVFWTFLAFNGDTDNGGVYQFIFNNPEFILAAAEMWEEIRVDKVSKDYNEVLKELSGKTGKISELKSAFNDNSKSWEKRWNSFTEGYKELKSAEVIENYYYDKKFKKECHKKVADYIERNMNKFRK